MGSIILAVIMKCLILLTIASSVLGDAEPSADPQYGYGGHGYGGHGYGGLGYGGLGYGAATLHGQHYGAGLLAHQYGATLPYNYPPQAAPASVEDTPASAVRISAPAPFTGFGPALPYGYAGKHGQGYPGYAGVHGYPGYAQAGYAQAGYGPSVYANGPAGYGYNGAYQEYTGWPYAAAPVAAAPVTAAAAKSE